MAKKDSVRNNPPPSGSASSGGSRLIGGFPDDYRVTYPDGHPAKRTLGEMAERRKAGLSVRAGYSSGDEWRPANASPDAIEALQASLMQAGLLSPNDSISPGRFDATTRAAYKKLLEQANGMGLDDGATLAHLMDNPLAHDDDGKAGGRAPLVKRLSNPDDLRRVFKAAAKRVLGSGEIDEKQLQKMISAYQSQEGSAQERAYNLAGGNSAGTITEPPDIETFALGQARNMDPVRADARSTVKVANVINQMMAGRLPSESPELPEAI